MRLTLFLRRAAMAPATPAFPVHGLLPKHETGAAAFLAANPESDGRGTTIAILDTGVDPGAPGLQATSTGEPKIVALIDCTGSGDVACSAIASPSPAPAPFSHPRSIRGLSGRILRLGDWPCPSNSFRLGIKHAADLFPKPLLDRLKKSRKERFVVQHHALVTAAESAALAKPPTVPAISQSHAPSASDSASAPASGSASGSASAPAPASAPTSATTPSSSQSEDEATLTKADLKSRVDVLKDYLKNYEDPGILLDCVVFHDGSKWRAVIDVLETGDLTSAVPLASYSDEHQYLCFDNDSMLNYSVNIYDEGQTISIVTLAGTHGTHVAAITAANHPDDPRLNGVAPGAQIVSLKIGDTRLGSMETGTGLVRAAIELARLNIDLANMSYGEAAAIPNVGRFIELIRDDIVNKKGCIFVSSAGNAGPALTTVGAPGGTSSAIIGVGAYVSHAMMDAEYAMLDKVQERPYTWSSRGPTADGDVGVDIFAPGAAITSVPQYTTYRSQLMNGTSMSSPNCCGCISLLVSGLKAKNIPYTPYLIKAAIKATGKDVSDPLGTRFIQVERAWEFLSKLTVGYLPLNVQYQIAILNRDRARGVYLRDAIETNEVQQLTVEVSPVFAREDDPTQNPSKLELEIQLSLCASDRWITCPAFLLLNSTARSFNIRVDPTMLSPGLHYGTVEAFDSTRPDIGPLFSVPVTVCKPEQINQRFVDSNAPCYIHYEGLQFKPGDIQRRFIHVPLGANFAELVVRSGSRQTPARFVVHMIQLQPQSRYTTFEREYYFTLDSPGSSIQDEEYVFRKQFAVLPNATIELCLAQFWSSLDPSTVSIELRFHGVLVSFSATTNGDYGASAGSSGMSMGLLSSGTHGFTRIDVSTPIRNEDIAPTISLGTLRKAIRPTESVISPLQSRDVLPDTRQLHQLVLTYTLKLTESATVTLHLPRTTRMLYDALFDNVCIYIHDTHKRVIAFNDVYPKPVSLTENTVYTIRVQLVSVMLELLDKVSNMCLVVDVSLSKAVSVGVYASLSDAVVGQPGVGVVKRRSMMRGGRVTVWAGEPASTGNGSGLPKDAKTGDVLMGKLDMVSTKIDGTLFQVAYMVPEDPGKKDASASISDTVLVGAKPQPKPDLVLMKESVRDTEITWVKKITSDGDRDGVFTRLETEYAGYLPLMRVKLELVGEKVQKIVNAGVKMSMTMTTVTPVIPHTLLVQLIDACDAVLHLVDENRLAQYFGVQHDVAQGGEQKRVEKRDMEMQKEAVVLAYRWKSTAYRYLVGDDDVAVTVTDTVIDTTVSTSDDLVLFDTMLAKYAKWLTPTVPTTDGAYLLLWAWRTRRRGHHGTVLKHLNKYINDTKNSSCVDDDASVMFKRVLGLRVDVLRDVGWDLYVDYESKWNMIKFPGEYPPF